MICDRCGKTVRGEEIAFCPYCGAKLEALKAEAEPARQDEKAAGWIREARSVMSYPDRKKILQQGLAECPDNRDLLWEMLFIGEEQKGKRGWIMDFSIIQCWVLEIYRSPRDFPEDRRDQMRSELFDAPRLKHCLKLFEDPEKKQQEYLLRLCREYVEIFLENNNEVMGSFLGFQIGRNKEKRLAEAAADMLKRVRADEKLLPDQREQLWNALYQASRERLNGKQELLDQMLGTA